MTWSEAVDIVQGYIFRISTPRGSGTGFMVSHSKSNELCVVATAAHVVDEAHYWEEPIRLDLYDPGRSILLRVNDRAIVLDNNRDTAAIVFNAKGIRLPDANLPLAPKKMYLRIGNEIGWLGFPAIPTANLCFFGGKVSSWIQRQEAYLVDGVAINGVSGGPAFHIDNSNNVVLMGVVSAYMPNRATGETLPGLAVVRNVAQLHEVTETLASLEQAQSKQTPAQQVPPKQSEGGDIQPTRRAT